MKPTAEILEVISVDQLEQVRVLFRSYQSQLPPELGFPDGEWQTLPGAYAPPRGALLLARISGQAAGCVGLRPFPLDGACEMKRLYVSPSFRGEHLGSALIEEVLRIARRLGYSCMRLDTHAATMGAALELYRRFGFVELPSHPGPQVEGLSYLELQL